MPIEVPAGRRWPHENDDSSFFYHLSKRRRYPILTTMRSTLARKQREIEGREERILEVAGQMIVDDGYHGLSMDRIAEAMQYSKGTIYQHFSCKEDILMALMNQSMQRRVELFRRAAAFRATTRERMSAIGAAAELLFQLYPDQVHIENTIRINSVRDKTSEKRRLCMETCEASCSEVVRGVIRDAVAAGDLYLPAESGVEHLAFGLWSITFGGHSIAATSPSLANLGIHNPILAIRGNCNLLLDGAGWRPLSTELDVDVLLERIKQEVFPQEFALLGRRGAR